MPECADIIISEEYADFIVEFSGRKEEEIQR